MLRVAAQLGPVLLLANRDGGDRARWAQPTEAWETRYEYPQLWGTRRIGRDLARESGVRSDDWQLVHLNDPRAVVAESNMFPFPWLFAGSDAHPTQEALDLLPYIQSLGRPRQLAGYNSPPEPAQGTQSPGRHRSGADRAPPPRKRTLRPADAQYEKWIAAGNEPLQVQAASNGIAFLPDSKNWKSISSTDRVDNQTIRVILGNDIAIKAIAENHINECV